MLEYIVSDIQIEGKKRNESLNHVLLHHCEKKNLHLKNPQPSWGQISLIRRALLAKASKQPSFGGE